MLAVAGTTAVIEVGGVGLAVQVTPRHGLTLRVGSEAMVRTALIVREDDLSLFGFQDADELMVFDLLRGTTGVGPKSAMGVLAAMTPSQIAMAVSSDDDAAFRKVSGIGPKTAKLIVVSLTGKIQSFASSAPAPATANTVTESVLVALVGLGWSERIAAQAVDEAVAEASADQAATVQQLLRLTLSRLGPQQSADPVGSNR